MEVLARRRVRLLAMLSVVFISTLPGGVLAQESGIQEQVTASNEIIVKFKPSESAAEKADARREESIEKISDLDLIQAEVAEVTGRPASEAARELENRPDIEYAVPNRIIYPAGYADEPRFGELWGLNNTGQTDGAGVLGTPDMDIDGLEASSVTQGAPNLVVAVIDDGVDFSHPDLADRAWTNPGETGVDANGNDKATNGEDDDNNGYPDDVNGFDFFNYDGSVHDPGEDYHGTHVAGTIAASVNGEGVVGVAPNVKVMALKFLGPSGGYLSDAILAIEYAKQNGVKISNNSWSTEPDPPDEPLKEAIEASGMLFVASAGNHSLDNDADPNNAAYPSSFDSPNILSVASSNNRGEMAFDSNHGATTVDIAAPGEEILSTMPGGDWGYLSGTSMAAPHATGTAALAASANPALLEDPIALKEFIMDGAKPLPASAGKTVTGGMVNANLDTTAPAITSVKPAPGAQQAPAYADIEAAFSEEMRASTLNTDTFTLVKQGATAPVAARVAYDAASKKAVLTTETDLAPSSTYTATIKGGSNGATDLFGNPLAADKVWSFATAPPDTTLPDTIITSGPDGYAASKSASFAFSSTEERSTFLCRMDGAAFGPCDSPKNYASLPEGLHTFEVKAVDHAGNIDPKPASRTWVLDSVAPTVSAPTRNFIVPSSLSVVTANYTVPVRISWSSSDQASHMNSGAARYELQRSVNGGEWSGDLLQQEPVSPAAGGPEKSITLSHTLDTTYKFRVRGQDMAGNWSDWAEGSSFSMNDYDEVHSSVTYPSGTWKRLAMSGSLGSYVKYATDAGARTRFSFTGRSVAWIAGKSSNRGQAEVWVDGVKVATVNQYSSAYQPRQILFQKSWASSGTHTVVIKALGAKSAASTNTRVDIDAFLAMD